MEDADHVGDVAGLEHLFAGGRARHCIEHVPAKGGHRSLDPGHDALFTATTFPPFCWCVGKEVRVRELYRINKSSANLDDIAVSKTPVYIAVSKTPVYKGEVSGHPR